MTEIHDTPGAKRRGRPREFDAEETVDRAMRTFWRRGYRAVSMTDLTEATGLGRASLYGAFGDKDALFRQAAEVCVQFQQGSTSLLQRRLRIGYGRAARIIDQLHNAGVLGPPDGSKPREVLVGMESVGHICGDD